MILVDANLLLYAEDELSPHNQRAREWWDAQISGDSPVCLCWSVLNAFLRISTSRKIFKRPLSILEATERIQSWLNQPCVRLIYPTERHWDILRAIKAQKHKVKCDVGEVNRFMKRIVHKSKNFAAAEKWDIWQQVNMTPRQRMEVAKTLRQRVYGVSTKDVRECHKTK